MAITSAHKTKQVVLHQPQTKPKATASAKFWQTNSGNNICQSKQNKTCPNKIAGQSNTVTPFGVGND